MMSSDSTLETGPTIPTITGPPPEPPLTCCKKFKYFLVSYWRGIVVILGPIIGLPVFIPTPIAKYQWCAYTLIVMAVYWVTECIPLPVTSFLPLIIFPITDVMNSQETAKCYFNDTLVMFYGSLVLASAVEQSGLHKRLAYCAIRVIGYSHYKLLFTLSFITMFISMWITNTAATTMMVPIIFALLEVFEGQKLLNIYEKNVDGDLIASDFTAVYFCAATYAATIGGIGTLVGTGTNLVFKGLLETAYPKAPEYLTFPLFSAFAVPLMFSLQIFVYISMIFIYFGFLRPKSKAAEATTIPPKGIEAAKEAVKRGTEALGPFTYWEGIVAVLFALAMCLFFSRSPQMFVGWADRIVNYFKLKNTKFIRDSAVAMAVSYLMLLFNRNWSMFKNCTAKIYEDLPKTRVLSVLDWTKMDAVTPYSFMFLLGGGFALSTAAGPNYSDLNGVIGSFLSKLGGLPPLLILFVMIAFTIFVTNFASNVAVANVIVPIAMTLAEKIKQNPLQYNIASGFSASFCFMLPVGTPGNLVVQSAAKIPTKKMMVAGFFPTISSTLLTWVAICFYAPVIWPDLNKGFPSWAAKNESTATF